MRYEKNFIYSSENCLGKMDQYCRDVFICHTFPYEEEILFAIHEAIINAIDEVKHFNNIEKKKLKIEIEITDNFVEAKVYNFTQNEININKKIADKDIDQDIWSTRGRGLLFISELVDDLYQEIDTSGRFVVVMKKLTGCKTI